MSIKKRLLFYFSFIAAISVGVSTYIAIVSVVNKIVYHQKQNINETVFRGEKEFYSILTDLLRKTIFISDMREIATNINNSDELNLLLEYKGFFFGDTNIIILNNSLEIKGSFINSKTSLITDKKDVLELPFLKNRNFYKRFSGILYKDKRILMLSFSPVMNPDTFDLIGFVILEKVVSDNFARELKSKIGADVLIISGEEKVVNGCTIETKNIKKLLNQLKTTNRETLRIEGKPFIYKYFSIRDYKDEDIGKVYVLKNIKSTKEYIITSVKNLLISAVFLYIFVLILSTVIGRRMAKPILKLVKVSEQISRGDYDIKVDIEGEEEIKTLAKALKNSSEAIRAYKKELSNMVNFFESIIRLSPSGIVICDSEGYILLLNSSAELMLGIGGPVNRINIFRISNSFLNIKSSFISTLTTGEAAFFRNFPIDIGETQNIVNLIMYRVPYIDSYYIALHIEDVTERFELEDKIMHYQKLGRLGEFLTKFTHDFRNILSGLEGHLSLLKSEIELMDDEKIVKRIEILEGIVRKAKQILRSILDFTKKKESKLKKINVCSSINEVLIVMRTVLKEINIEYPKECNYFIYGNEDRFAVALLNLIVNAKDAVMMSNKKEKIIKIRVKKAHIEGKKGSFIKIEIEDNGLGIDDKIIRRIFDPFFSTKGEKGTGIGLSTVKEIVDEFNGFIEVQSDKGIGTVFIIYIPEYIN